MDRLLPSGMGVKRLPLPASVRATMDAELAVMSRPPDLTEHAAGLLLGKVSTIAEPAAARLRTEIPYYASAATCPADMPEAVYGALEVAIRSLATPGRFSESAELAWHLGQLRADEGMPLLPLLQAYRIGADMLWDALVAAQMSEAPANAHRMVYCANDFWRYCDRDIRLMVEAHRRASEGISADDGRHLLPALKALLRGHSDPIDVSRAAIGLDLPLTGRYLVARFRDLPTDPSSVAIRDEVAGMPVYRCPQRTGMSMVVFLDDRAPEELGAALAAVHPGVGVGVSPVVDGLTGLGRAHELAELALRTGRGGELVFLRDRIPEALMAIRPDLAAEHAATVLGPVLELAPADGQLLLDTLEAWLDCQGSAVQAGKLLYCHHNTVLKRLRRLERLTGRFVDRPRDLVELSLALDAINLARPTPSI
ncbi:helix-turn-helix domain-containing protein [Nocardia sp. A7]|uniref:helix-turn-helix domain-containing protein n=1 Tax=Nocardia sp. A7 TaxID=2789274 RepID=UPI00397A3550